ncbi:MAG: replication-associated recombination protein A [Selenomonadaceae bacterium]|nr:replication-associated recombination protein A [Selenomonadaceae bacterium]
MNLFESVQDKSFQPLAEKLRPQTLKDFVGQEKILSSLGKMINDGRIFSMIFYGAPGTGKTTLAKIIANTTKCNFVKVNAALAGIKDLREIVKSAEDQKNFYGRRTILFIDEIHRFNKSQQDFLLPYVEDGRLILIGATTENPFFEVNPALLSRVKIVQLKKLSPENIKKILQRAINLEKNLAVEDKAVEIISDFADGDARIALNILEQLIFEGGVTVENLREILGEKVRRYDKDGDNHYDTASAFIKSMRGSDPNAAIFYLAKMIDGGEDLTFIARRIVICAAEDVGNADPTALILANAAAQAVQFVGLPEARIILAQAVTYIAGAPKSNAAYLAIDAALADVKNNPNADEVPAHLRDTHYKGAKFFGNGKGYKYPHDFENHFVNQQYLPDSRRAKQYYFPTENGREAEIKKFLQKFWQKNF